MKNQVNEFWEKTFFVERALSFNDWLIHADGLLKTALMLEPRLKRLYGPVSKHPKRTRNKPPLVTIQGIYFMLTAYALENLCKAVIIKKTASELKSTMSKTGCFPTTLITHNLVRLVKEVGIVTNHQEEEMLIRLERNAVWFARYPVPTSYEKLNHYVQISNGQRIFISFFRNDDIERIKKLVRKVRNIVKNSL